MGYSEHTDIILNWIELNWTKESAQKADPGEENSPIFLAGKVQLSDHKWSPVLYHWAILDPKIHVCSYETQV